MFATENFECRHQKLACKNCCKIYFSRQSTVLPLSNSKPASEAELNFSRLDSYISTIMHSAHSTCCGWLHYTMYNVLYFMLNIYFLYIWVEFKESFVWIWYYINNFRVCDDSPPLSKCSRSSKTAIIPPYKNFEGSSDSSHRNGNVVDDINYYISWRLGLLEQS